MTLNETRAPVDIVLTGLDAAKERKVFAIGNVIDTQKEYPGTVVASALWQMEPTIDRAIAAVAGGGFAAEDYGNYSFMVHGGASLAPMDEKLIGAKTMAAVKAREAEIRDGLFRVNVNDSEPRSSM